VKAAVIKSKMKQERQADSESKWRLPSEHVSASITPECCGLVPSAHHLCLRPAALHAPREWRRPGLEMETQPCVRLVQHSPPWMQIWGPAFWAWRGCCMHTLLPSPPGPLHKDAQGCPRDHVNPVNIHLVLPVICKEIRPVRSSIPNYTPFKCM